MSFIFGFSLVSDSPGSPRVEDKCVTGTKRRIRRGVSETRSV